MCLSKLYKEEKRAWVTVSAQNRRGYRSQKVQSKSLNWHKIQLYARKIYIYLLSKNSNNKSSCSHSRGNLKMPPVILQHVWTAQVTKENDTILFPEAPPISAARFLVHGVIQLKALGSKMVSNHPNTKVIHLDTPSLKEKY